MYAVACLFFVFLTVVARHAYSCAERKSAEKVYEQTYHTSRSAHSRKRAFMTEFADYDKVGRVEKLLKHHCQHKRHGEGYHFAQKRARTHINFVLFHNCLSSSLFRMEKIKYGAFRVVQCICGIVNVISVFL